jgi:hypothetical protein
MLDPELASDPTSFSALRWKYLRCEQYGSGEFSIATPNLDAEKAALLGESKSHREHDKVEILSTTLLDDGKSIEVELANHQPSMQLRIDYDLESTNGDELIGTIHSTIHQIPTN